MSNQNIGCSFKFIRRVGVEESIVTTNNAKSEVRFKQLELRGAFTIDSSTPTLRVNLNEHPIQVNLNQEPLKLPGRESAPDSIGPSRRRRLGSHNWYFLKCVVSAAPERTSSAR
jgi:hypothetical protein